MILDSRNSRNGRNGRNDFIGQKYRGTIKNKRVKLGIITAQNFINTITLMY